MQKLDHPHRPSMAGLHRVPLKLQPAVNDHITHAIMGHGIGYILLFWG